MANAKIASIWTTLIKNRYSIQIAYFTTRTLWQKDTMYLLLHVSNKYECSKFHSKTNYLTVTKFIKHLTICIRWWYKLYHPQKKQEFQNNIHITNHHQSSSLFFVQPSGLAPFLKRKKTKFLTPYDAIWMHFIHT